MSQVEQRRVAILLDTTGSAGRLMLRGIGAYARTNRQWTCQFQSPSLSNLGRLKSWRPDGVIGEVFDSAWVTALRELGVPIVDVADALDPNPFPLVSHDNHAIGKAAAAYLLGRGFVNLAFVGIIGPAYSRRRRDGFVRAARAAKASCIVHEVGRPALAADDGVDSSADADADAGDWDANDRALREFIGRLPDPPVGVFASNDGRAIQFIEAGRELGLNIPSQVAIVGCDDDDLLCELARPPLSSVVPASERVGFEGALLLERMMLGLARPPKRTLLKPLHVVTRQSSEIMAVSNPDVARALMFIRRQAHRPLSADDVVHEVSIARRSLERRFKEHLGHTLHDEILAAHVDLARQLLVHTDVPIPDVAERCGFGSLRAMLLGFKSLTGVTPSKYRRDRRLR